MEQYDDTFETVDAPPTIKEIEKRLRKQADIRTACLIGSSQERIFRLNWAALPMTVNEKRLMQAGLALDKIRASQAD
jgi:hypothetical protein